MSIVSYQHLESELIRFANERKAKDLTESHFLTAGSATEYTIENAPKDTLLMLIEDNGNVMAGSIFLNRTCDLNRALLRHSVECSSCKTTAVFLLTQTERGLIVVEAIPYNIRSGKFVKLIDVMHKDKPFVQTDKGISFHGYINKYFVVDGPVHIVNESDTSDIRYRLELSDEYELTLSKQILVPKDYGYRTLHTENWAGLPLAPSEGIPKLFDLMHYGRIVQTHGRNNRIEKWFNKINLPIPLIYREEFTRTLYAATPLKLLLDNVLPPNLNLIYIYRLIGEDSMKLLYDAYISHTLNTSLLEQLIPDEVDRFDSMEW